MKTLLKIIVLLILGFLLFTTIKTCEVEREDSSMSKEEAIIWYYANQDWLNS